MEDIYPLTVTLTKEDGRITFFEKVLARRRYTYDAFGRVSSTETLGRDYAEIFRTTYTYNDTDTTVSGQVSSLTHDGPQYDKTYSYTYDDNGNILSVTEIIPRTQFDNLEDLLPDESFDTTLLPPIQHPVSYVYDSANQLIRENNQAGNFTYTWTYDNAGNILERKEYAYTTGSLEGVTPTDTVTYTYGDEEWGDLLTSYDGNAITYDQIGNPLTDGTWTYTWQHGRQLASMTDGTTTWDYTYDANGLRTERTDGTDTYRYVYDGGKLTFMARNGLYLRFAYTPEGTPLSVLYKGTTYYYVTNLQGDVTAILSQNGYVMVEYTYDAWGNLLTTTGSLANSLGRYNPLRYRGYVYDQETGLYYLQSRYYNPRVGRFINADGLISTSQGVLGNNLFAYCGGDPINRVDAAGRKWLKNLWNDFWQGIKGWLGDEKEKAKTNDNITTTSGVTASGAFGGGASASLGATSDTKGNVGISFTINGGGGFPSAGVGVFVSGNNAPTIFEQSGLGTTVGASGGPWIVSVGGDYNMLINQDANRTYHGGTFSASLGFYPTVVEVHGEVGYTWVWGFNVYDVAIDIADFMLMEE